MRRQVAAVGRVPIDNTRLRRTVSNSIVRRRRPKRLARSARSPSVSLLRDDGASRVEALAFPPQHLVDDARREELTDPP